MGDIAISVNGLGKRYQLGAAAVPRYKTVRDAIMQTAGRLIRHGRRPASREPFWALKDVSFEVKRGQVVGIIGRNGAGKSTLLKILSRITEPSEGGADIHGRVGSLLEVGTGFHPELSGRENIFLNGAILGMRRSEITRKFDEIVAFAEIEKFIDTPVKHYSSGMYMRLAFAVAAHLEPEILIVDEVLAVGDAEFQKKCLGKMGDVARGGRTVLFVSHNMQAVQQLCTSGIVLLRGQTCFTGAADAAVQHYTAGGGDRQSSMWERPHGIEQISLCVEEVNVHLAGEQPNHTLEVNIRLRSRPPHKAAFLAIDFHDAAGIRFMQTIPRVTPFIFDDCTLHALQIVVALPPLVPSVYAVAIWLGSHNTETFDQTPPCVSFTIDRSPTPSRTFPHSPAAGSIVPESWIVSQSI
ncbi:ABC transporter ATP-binding protein [Humisphaera borealis]|uniref:ABC transporter ATP-binding protein n=1 Tax=Humisphaera borealis TaxID=2807512 RepID=A0A7M2X0L2_9BACT|nr:ABC transporter ATP-binding protein [Humisphaera borealis]QOV90641.1 ABC transporter ATP-binding protein [Humisphaera borealis]